MAKRNPTERLVDDLRSQHIALSVAAGLARTQLIPDPTRVYDSQHLSESLNHVARGLAKVAQLYLATPGETPRPLAPLELEGAQIQRGATLVVLKDGRKLSAVSMKRADLRQAVAILKTIGIQEFAAHAPQPAAPEPAHARLDPLAQLGEIERLLTVPLVAPQVGRANSLAVALARSAPQGCIANLAMQLVSAVHEAQGEQTPDDNRLKLALAKLRDALEDEPSSPPPLK
jgi:hypothetical protein